MMYEKTNVTFEEYDLQKGLEWLKFKFEPKIPFTFFFILYPPPRFFIHFTSCALADFNSCLNDCNVVKLKKKVIINPFSLKFFTKL